MSLPVRIFLVEDSLLFRERLIEHLRIPARVDFVGLAADEDAAVSALEISSWDVAIIDMQLKNGSGMGVLKRLHLAGRRPGTTVIMLTNHDYHLYRAKARELGADCFFSKHRDLQTVTGVLERLVAAG